MRDQQIARISESRFGATPLIVPGRRNSQKRKYWTAGAFWLVGLLICAPPLRAELEVFASFEDPAEVASIKTSPGVHFQSSTRFPAWEGKSLEVQFPSGGGWIQFPQIPSDWRWQESLLLFAWSEQPATLRLELMDRAGGKYAKAFQLRRGANHLQLPLAQAQTLNRGQMQSLTLSGGQPGTFYLDYFALDRFHPVLEQRGRWDIDYSMQAETPHVPWARPFAGGPIKVFAIADVADGRGMIELAERLEMDFRATTIGSSPGINKWGFGDFYRQRSGGGEFWKDAYSLAHNYIADDLLNGPQREVILWPGIRPWESYPREVREALQKRVEAGAGLVLFSPFQRSRGDEGFSALSPLALPDLKSEDGNNFFRNRFESWDHSEWKPTTSHYITRGIPFEAFPWEQMAVPPAKAAGEVLLTTAQGTPVLAVREVGKGRVVAFGYAEKGMIPEIHEVFETGLHYPYQEYLWSLVARAVIWAARREPAGSIEKITTEPRGASIAISPGHPPGLLEVRVKNSFGETEDTFSLSTASRPGPIQLAFSRQLSGGLHFLEARLLHNEKVTDWATSTFQVPSPARILSIQPAQDRVQAGQPIPVHLRLQASRKTAVQVRVRLLDNYDRLLDQRQFETEIEGETPHQLTLSTSGALAHLARVDCEILAAGVHADRQVAEFFILQPRKWDDYDIVMYRFGPDPIPGIWPSIDRQMQRLWVSTLSSYSLSHSKHANYQVQAQTRISGQESPDGPARNYYTAMKKKYLATGDKMTLVREYCLDDPGYRELIRRELREKTAPWVPFSPLSYYVYEEPSLTCYEDAVDICFSPFTLAAMRRWLRDQYQTLEQLNQQWTTQFDNWEAVVPDDAPQAQARGNYASWADHRTYMEKTYADSFAFVLEELRQVDPEGILLNSGTQVSGSHNGCDYSRLNLYTHHLNAYDGGNQLDFHRCFNPEVKISGGAGYGVLGPDVFYDFYSNLFKGASGGAYIFWQYSTLDPDLTMSQSGKDMEKGFQELRGDGIGKLLGQAIPDNHGIAIHYSYPSIHGAWIVDGKVTEEASEHTSQTLDRFNANRDGWVKILKDLGLQFDFIAYGDLEKEGVLAQKYRTLILPMSVALSDREVSSIREFVRQGGTLVADAMPGIMDQHCSFRTQRALLDLFGIDLPRGSREALATGKGEKTLRTITARSLAPAGGQPTFLANRYGDGRAYYLNTFLDSYPADKLEGRTQDALANLQRVLLDARLQPKVRIRGKEGRPISSCSAYLLNLGTTRLLGLIPDKKMPAAEPIRIEFEGVSTIYDVRKKRSLGSASKFETIIEPAVPCVFALIANPVGSIKTLAPAQARLGEEIEVRMEVDGPASFQSVAKVTVLSPAGETIRYYGKNIDIRDNRGSFRFRTALNDLPGEWTVTITDVVSGVTGKVKIRVQRT